MTNSKTPKVRIKKGDTVLVISGREKGKQGTVIKVLRRESRVLVQGVNMVKRHTRPSQVSAGGVLEKEAPVHISNVAFVDPKEGGPTKLGVKILKDGRKVRVAKRSGEVVDA
ncbi:MAG: 50S ribosomal protein L24 [Alphaproteobacteria bacterium]|jgi:large subunit ribosomal protein L24|nr:50S ribosomal protein L24 [Alphaproteobacteria bacterium]MBT5860587.1 50S ribosomal protein L24 [Alphaproteobacteria bacterium]